jgi:hypothetical protein
MIRVFIGYDSRMPAASSVLAHSINARASAPVSVSLISLSQVSRIFNRVRDPLQSTEFSFSRFLVPYLSAYKGFSIFMDNDMIVLDDIAELWALRDERYAVQCVKHDHKPQQGIKFLGEKQTAYEKKNWSSVMIFNNAKCGALTPAFVNAASGLELHQFKWLASDDLVGAIPPRWNHLVGYDAPNPDVSLVHYTSGGPYHKLTRDCEYAAEWFRERDDMLRVAGS